MIRSALIIVAGALAAVCFACVAVPPPQASFTLAARKAPHRIPAVLTTCSDGSDFLQHVFVLPNGYNPSPNPGLGPIGTPVPIDPSNSPYAEALENAFQLAPAAFQNRLCGLGPEGITAVYINGPESCDTVACLGTSWGIRAYNAGGRYIAISAGLWNLACHDGTTPYVYHCFESDLLNASVRWNGEYLGYGNANNGPTGADTFDVTILAALAHEVGHVRWYDIFNPDNPGNGYDPSNSDFCGGDFFSDSWKKAHKPPQWRRLADRNQANGGPDRHLMAPQISDVDRAIRTGDIQGALTFLDELYQPAQPWASYLGAISPDEDFVETYKLWVLTNAQTRADLGEGPLTSLPITFVSGPPENIPSAYGVPDPKNFGAPSVTQKEFLAAKAACIGQKI